MYLLYVDESGDPGERGSDYLILGAVALFEGKWQEISDKIDGVVSRYFPGGNKPGELHFTELRSGKGEFRSLSKSRRGHFLKDYCFVMDRLLSFEIAFFSVIAEKATWFAKNPGKSGDDLYMELFEDLSSRFDLFLRRQHVKGRSNRGVIIADPHKPSLSKVLKENQRRFQTSGTRWAKVFNLIETIFFLDSQDSPGLQLADLCSFGVWRLVTANDDSFIKLIRNYFDREPFDSEHNQGKWHGVKFIGEDPSVQQRIDRMWPSNT